MKKGNVRYIVDDVASAIEFYTNLLGFQLQMHPSPGFAALENEEFRLFINQPGAGGAGKDTSEGQTPEPGGWNRMQFKVDDLNSMYASLKEKGASFRNDITEGKGGKQVLLEDPSGNLVELFEPRKKKAGHFVPNGYRTVTPYLAIQDADKLVEFLQKVFDAKEHRLWRREDGSFMHGEFRIGDSLVMIGDVQEAFDSFPGMLYVYVQDVDATFNKAIKEGAKVIEKPSQQDYGDRRAAFEDLSGNQWWIATHVEDVPDEEVKRK